MKFSRFLLILTCCFLYACSGKGSKDSGENTYSRQADSLESGQAVVDDIEEIGGSDTLTYVWSDMCEYRGFYLPGQYTHEELQATYDVWMKLSSGFTAAPSVYSPSDIDEIDLSGMKKEYEELVAFVDNADIVDAPFWKEFVIVEKRSIKKQYDLLTMRSKAYTDPSVLLNNPYLDEKSECNQYVKALNASDEELYTAWMAWANEAKKSNGDPDGFMRRFYDKYNSSDKKRYAYIDLIGFGWWNCVNHAVINYPDYTQLFENFSKLFIKVEEFNCEEP